MGIVAASIPGQGNVIYACYVKATGALRVIDHPTAKCLAFETLVSWNQQGVAGSNLHSGKLLDRCYIIPFVLVPTGKPHATNVV
jgi:hypothetical protein